MASDDISGSSTNPRLNPRTEDQTDPYHLQSGDSPGTVLVSQVLVGNENYNTWSMSMTIALDAKTKIGFVNGDILMPDPSESLFALWKKVNSMVASWILNSVSKEIASSIIYIKSAHEMWIDLKERFYEKNNPRVFQLKKAICELHQGSMSVNVYFTKLKTLWEEYCNCSLIPHCSNGSSCAALKMILELQQKEYTMQFLMGLDDGYASLRSQILMNDPLPSINKVFASVIQEERQRNISPSINSVSEPVAFASKTENPRNFTNFNNSKNGYKKEKSSVGNYGHVVCTYCGLNGHVVDKCYRLYGFPPGFKFKNKNGNQGHGNSTGNYGNYGHVGNSQAASVQGNMGQGTQLQQPFSDQGNQYYGANNYGNQQGLNFQPSSVFQNNTSVQSQNPQVPITYAQYQQLISQYQQLMGAAVPHPNVQFGASTSENANANACFSSSVPMSSNQNQASTMHRTSYVQNLSVRPRKRRWLWLTISGPAVSLVVLSILSLLCYRGKLNYCCFGFGDTKRSRSQGDTELMMNELGATLAAIDKQSGARKVDLSGKRDPKLHLFNFSSIQVATENFSDANKIGQGGFGPVYKAKLVDGQEIAVKRLSRTSGQGLEEFKNEVILISKLQHRNLVTLLGCCIQGEERILIYEYLPNKSLDYFLFDATKRALLDWKKRSSIITGIAQGLLYLHKYSKLRIIHRDLKTSNILLDSNMNPKISDFGTARIFGEDESRANTNRIVGTYGYMSPEYAMDGLFSVKSDVFSFGVMMLEIVSGKKNTGFYQSNRYLNLLGYAWDLWKEGRCLELMQQELIDDDSCSTDDVMRCVQVGLLCVQENATNRPTMSDVMSMLSHELVNLPAPKQPAFLAISSVNDNAVLLENPKPCSINGVTTSEIQAR